ncbi:hypothetical protein [Chitinophaga sp. RAB17]|uniref:hypothetical protein n=1 Tax=Chitinophaga sp. RAB17 TaxID=3233049 RepID=UPI003F8DE998
MKKTLILCCVAISTAMLFLSGTTFGKPCQDDHRGKRGKCRTTVIDGVYYFDCVTPVDPLDTDCSVYLH